MKFKVLKGTPLFDKLTNLKKEIDAANNAARDLVKELGYENYCKSLFDVAGGISAIIIPEGKPAGWRFSFNDRQPAHAYFPSSIKANKELLERIKKLPIVSTQKLNSLINYGSPFSTPGISWRKNYILISTRNEYKPVKDMVEILESEYKKLESK